MTIKFFGLALVAGLATTPVLSTAADVKSLSIHQSRGLIKQVRLVVKDNVTGNCWTNVNHVKQNSRWKLEQSHIAVEDPIDPDSQPTNALMYVYGVGRRVRGNCFGSIDVELTRLDGARYSDTRIITEVRLFRCGSFAWGSSLNDSIAATVDECVAEFAGDVLEYRRDPAVQTLLKNLPTQVD